MITGRPQIPGFRLRLTQQQFQFFILQLTNYLSTPIATDSRLAIALSCQVIIIL